jgi:hypothetical protein
MVRIRMAAALIVGQMECRVRLTGTISIGEPRLLPIRAGKPAKEMVE